MKWSRLDPAEVRKAIHTYLKIAYDGSPPAAVTGRIQSLMSAPDEQFYQSEVLERSPDEAPNRYSLRLGNRLYPHMKLTIDQRPDKRGFLLRADTHDRHCCPPAGSAEYPAFRELMEQNQKLARRIEQAWEEQGLPTFKNYLRQDLRRRLAGKQKR